MKDQLFIVINHNTRIMRKFIHTVPVSDCKLMSSQRTPKYAKRFAGETYETEDYFIPEDSPDYIYLEVRMIIHEEQIIFESEKISMVARMRYHSEYNKLYYSLVKKLREKLKNIGPDHIVW